MSVPGTVCWHTGDGSVLCSPPLSLDEKEQVKPPDLELQGAGFGPGYSLLFPELGQYLHIVGAQ